MRTLKALFLALLLLPSIAFGQLTREADGNVVLRSGQTAVRFHWRYGGALLQAYRRGFPPLIDEGAGAAWQSAVRVGGNDPTEASPNGVMEWPIARIGAPETWGNSYYGRETRLDSVYERRQFMPDFWLSTERCDDAIAGGRWLTRYQPGNEAATLELPVRPVIFEGSPSAFTGMFFVGDERSEDSPWATRLREYRNGRVAFKVTVSLAAAPWSAFAGVVFRKDVPQDAQTVADAYRAPGLALLVNKVGGWALTRTAPGGSESTLVGGSLSAKQRAQLEAPGGLQLEARTHNTNPGYVEIWIGGQLVRIVNDDLALHGPHVGLLANASSGRIFFQQRAIVDVGIELTARYSGWEGAIVSDITVKNAPGVDEPHVYDRANLTAAFLNPITFAEDDRMIAELGPNGQIWPLVPWSYPLAPAFGWWAGNRAGTAGIACVPEVFTVDGRQMDGAHVFLKEKTETGGFVLMLNPLPPEVENEAHELRFRARWFTSLSEVH